jgi:hypothetical protein
VNEKYTGTGKFGEGKREIGEEVLMAAIPDDPLESRKTGKWKQG